LAQDSPQAALIGLPRQEIAMLPFRSPHRASAHHEGAPAPGPVPEDSLIADRGEFIDALARLRRGQLLVHSADRSDERCLIEGQMLYTSWKPLSRFGLLDELPAGPREGRMRCYKLSPRGRDFADRACQAWKARPLWQRLAMRLGG
jgi:hypothetical protein